MADRIAHLPERTDDAPAPSARVPATARVPLLEPADMSPEQRTFFDSVVSGPRGQMIGPLRAAIHSPELATLWSGLGEFLRYRTCIDAAASELAIITCGRRWTSHVEWWAHVRAGLEAGIEQHVIDAIRDLRPPRFTDPALRDVYEFARILQQDGRVPAALHDAISAHWGTRGVVELTAVIGYYTMVAMTLNAHELPLPDGIAAVLPAADSLVALPAGIFVTDD